MTNSLQSVLIDHREPPWLHKINVDAPIVVTQLQCGDIWLATSDGALIIVERKTSDDLLASIADGRLFDQAAAMVQTTPWSYIAVEGYLSPTADGRTACEGVSTGWLWASVQGALQTVQELGVAIVYLSGREEVAPYLKRLAGRDRGNVRAGGPRKPELLAPGMLTLMSLPGIGSDRAKLLLEQLSGAAWALEYLTDENWQSEHVPGIGDGVRVKVREALSLPDGAKLAVVTETTLDAVPAPTATRKVTLPADYGLADANRDLF